MLKSTLILVLAGFMAALAVALAAPSGPTGLSSLAASGPITAAKVPLPPMEDRVNAVADPVFFVNQAGIDQLCGGTDQIIACAMIGGGMMVLPDPCEPRFAGESYAAVVCHEKGHTNGWSHDSK